jgi:citrate lyase subunit beta/citryl-CoA lyase
VIDWQMQTLRSLLFAPGNSERKLAKVGTFGSDAIVIDLEDAVADAEKDAARAMVRAALPTYDERTVVMVRVNGHDTGRMEDDLLAVACADLDAVVVPKLERPETLARVDAVLDVVERTNGLDPGSIRVVGTIETARGIVRCEEIALAAPARTITLAFGSGDFSTDLQVDLTPDGAELAYARGRVIVAARAAGMRAPIDGPYLLDLNDLAGLEADTRRSRQVGFEGRVIVYPPQVEVAQRVYSELSAEEAGRAQRIVDAFEAAESSGNASIQVDGRFVDYPIYDRARQKLRLHRAASS